MLPPSDESAPPPPLGDDPEARADASADQLAADSTPTADPPPAEAVETPGTMEHLATRETKRPQTIVQAPTGLPLVVRIAAGLVAIGVIGAMVWAWPKPDLTRSFAQVAEPGSSPVATTLPDDSDVLLRSGASLRAVGGVGGAEAPRVLLTPTDRHYILRGDARFTILPDPSNPFVIDAGPVRVTTPGARFAIAASDSSALVYVESGSVTVEADSVRTVGGGQQAAVRGRRLGLPTAAASPDAILDWTTGTLLLDRTPFTDATDELSRHFGSAVRVPPLSRGRRLTGTFRLTTLDSALAVIGDAAGGTFVRSGNAYVFTQR